MLTNRRTTGRRSQILEDHEKLQESLFAVTALRSTSPRMKECMPGDTFDDDGELGYCWMHRFKCHSANMSHLGKRWPIKSDKESAEWQRKNSEVWVSSKDPNTLLNRTSNNQKVRRRNRAASKSQVD